MKILFKTLISNFFTDYLNIVYLFVLPIIFMLVLGYSFGYETTLSGMLFFPIVIMSFLIMPKQIYKYKNDKFLILNFGNKVNSYKITFLVSICFFSILMIWITILFSLFFLFFLQYYNTGFKIKNELFLNNETIEITQEPIKILFEKYKSPLSYLEMYFYFGYASILGIAWSFCCNGIFKNYGYMKLTNILLFIYNILFIGLLIPYYIIQKTPFLYAISFFAPFKYLASMDYISMFSNQNDFLNTTSSGVFDFTNGFWFRNRYDITLIDPLPNQLLLFSGIEKLMNFTIPFVLISLCISFASMRFRWFDKNIELYEKPKIKWQKNFKIYGWILYVSAFVPIFCLLTSGIIFLVFSNHIVTEYNIFEIANIDTNITEEDLNKISISSFDNYDTYLQYIFEVRNIRIDYALLNYLNSKNLTASELAQNTKNYNLEYTIGSVFVSTMIMGISAWSGMLINRIYSYIQISIANIYEKTNIL